MAPLVADPGSVPRVLVHPDADVLAAAVAARLLTDLRDLQEGQARASVALTGGGIGIGVLAAVAASDALRAVDWSRVDLWWGDERWLPAGDGERNETQARAALLGELSACGLSAEAMHPMGADDGSRTVEQAAADYAAAFTAAGPVDIVMLGVGPDAHVASLFPGHPALDLADVRATAVHGSPKPPPTRISLTLRAINDAAQVWLLAAGDSKADAVAAGVSSGDVLTVPAAGVRGRVQTLWLVDEAAAAHLPKS